VDQAVDGVLNLALQLPTLQKLGKSIGLSLDLDDDEAPPRKGPNEAPSGSTP
jgi:hypothetical protein